jgi:hypothetical protein
MSKYKLKSVALNGTKLDYHTEIYKQEYRS